MKYRIVEDCGLFYPEYKEMFFWKKIPVRMHTWDYRYVHYASSYEIAQEAIKVFKEKGDISKYSIRGVE